MPMERVSICHDRRSIGSFLRRESDLNIFVLADLDPERWRQSSWYALERNRRIRAIAVLLRWKGPFLVLLAARRDMRFASRLLREIRDVLPARFGADLSVGLKRLLRGRFSVVSRRRLTFIRMGLKDPRALRRVDAIGTVPLGWRDYREMVRFYRKSYPRAFLTPDRLAPGYTFGVRRNGKLVSAAGTFLFSRRYRVASLASIATHPSCRRQGLAAKCTARVFRALAKHVDHVGLLVKDDNRPAIRLYRKLGFREVGRSEILHFRAKA